MNIRPGASSRTNTSRRCAPGWRPATRFRPTRARRAAYALSGYRIRFQQRGRGCERSFEQGNVHFHEAGPHKVENIGGAPAEFVVFGRTLQQRVARKATHWRNRQGR